jgi:hypothetical protein
VGRNIYRFKKAEGTVMVCNAPDVQWSMPKCSVYCVYNVSELHTYVRSLTSGSKFGQ